MERAVGSAGGSAVKKSENMRYQSVVMWELAGSTLNVKYQRRLVKAHHNHIASLVLHAKNLSATLWRKDGGSPRDCG
ncbi:unnamed protein product, partial [Ceratitis capitata]